MNKTLKPTTDKTVTQKLPELKIKKPRLRIKSTPLELEILRMIGRSAVLRRMIKDSPVIKEILRQESEQWRKFKESNKK